MNSFHYIVLFLLIFTVVSCSETEEEQLRKRACESHSCHQLTQCHAVRKKKEGSEKWTYEPVCMKIPSCSTKKCDPGEKCELREIRCQLSPCFKIPTCLPDVNDAIPEFQMPPALLVKR